MKIVIAPNSFKGSLTASRAAACIADGLRASGLPCALHLLPLADGGDGTLDAFLSGGGTRHETETCDAHGRPMRAAWALLPDGQTAVIEMARASGLALLPPDQITPEHAARASTYGTGLLIRAALDAGARTVIVGLGGSATTDGGAGCLRALGGLWLDGDGRALPDGGAALAHLARIDTSGLDARLAQTAWVIASDVSNPAVGPHGAAHTFGGQKGADAAMRDRLDDALTHFFTVIAAQTGIDVLTVPGGGAAGAFAAGLLAFTGARIESGVELLLDRLGFDGLCADADLVITGEGQFDAQTAAGKAPAGVARRAARFGVPTVALVGAVRASEADVRAAGLAAALPIVTQPMSLAAALADAESLLTRAAQRLGEALGGGGSAGTP